MFIHCENVSCKHYYEDSCVLDLNDEMICIGSSGQCENYECGRSDFYDALETLSRCDSCIYNDEALSVECYSCVKGVRNYYERG